MAAKDIAEYKICNICKVGLVKSYSHQCKVCHPKRISDKKDTGPKIFGYKFKNNRINSIGVKGSKILLNPNTLISEQSLVLNKEIPQAETSLVNRQHNRLYILPSWEKFINMNEFANYIINSERISFYYLVNSYLIGLQNNPNFKFFTQGKIENLPPITKEFNDNSMVIPIARPLQLIYQKTFWDSLIESYFWEFHRIFPLFSIKSFKPEACSNNLLSAIYCLGFQYKTEYHQDLQIYMDKYAEEAIKKILKEDNLQNCQALFIFCYIKYNLGDLNTARCFQAYLTRMAYALGLHLDCKYLAPIDRYNRKLLFTNIKWININISGSHNFSPCYLTEYGGSNVSLFEPKWQKPDETTFIYFDGIDENEAYSICITEYHKFQDICTNLVWFPSFYNIESKKFMGSWNSRMRKLSEAYGRCNLSFIRLKQRYKIYYYKILAIENQVKMFYYFSTLQLYELLKHRNDGLKPDQQAMVLSNCDALFDCLRESNIPSPFLQVYAYLVGLHYLNIYHQSISLQKKRTKERLKQVLNYLESKFLKLFTLNYLMLKVGFELIDDGK